MAVRSIIFLVLLITSFACVMHDLSPVLDCKKESPVLTLVQKGDATSCEVSDGFISVNASGGTLPHSFSIGNTLSADGIFENLASGAYTVTVTDANGCTSALNNILVTAEGFAFEANVAPDTDCTQGNGSISVVVHEGTAPYLFKFADGEFAATSEFTSLRFGNYKLEVKDALDCSAHLDITVPKDETNTSWTNTIRPLIVNHCSATGCHNGVSRPDLRLYEKAKFYASQIKSLTADRSMPFEGSLTQDQIDLISCWVDEGAREN
jgi:hypothetical protein